MRYKAILFDLDGTLVDSIDAYRDACTHAMQSIGLDLHPEEFEYFYATGTSIEEWIRRKGGSTTLASSMRSAT